MTDKDILKYGEIQYLKGRLDELFKSFDIMLDVHGSRKLDQRIEKYIQKLKTVDEVAYYLYEVELKTTRKAKERSKKDIKELLEEVLNDVSNEEILEKIKNQIDRY
jgi:phosphoglycerate-specific signal transduction histidine kinase